MLIQSSYFILEILQDVIAIAWLVKLLVSDSTRFLKFQKIKNAKKVEIKRKIFQTFFKTVLWTFMNCQNTLKPKKDCMFVFLNEPLIFMEPFFCCHDIKKLRSVTRTFNIIFFLVISLRNPLCLGFLIYLQTHDFDSLMVLLFVKIVKITKHQNSPVYPYPRVVFGFWNV